MAAYRNFNWKRKKNNTVLFETEDRRSRTDNVASDRLFKLSLVELIFYLWIKSKSQL